jgi:RimJ/RimL family protein N-acetyltransferase
MAFGRGMRVHVGEYLIELSTISKDDVDEFLEGISSYNVQKYLHGHGAFSLEGEVKWREDVLEDTSKLVWSIWVIVSDEEKILIGVESLFDITLADTRVYHATSGSMIFRQEYWGKGIATAIHKVRTWYAFQHMGMSRIMSSVSHGNIASLKALRNSGYTLVYVERNTMFIDGKLRHQDNLECLNPNEPFWSEWWHGENLKKSSLQARQITLDVMEWAQENVTLL